MSEAVLPPTRTLDREKAFSFLRENGVYVDGACHGCSPVAPDGCEMGCPPLIDRRRPATATLDTVRRRAVGSTSTLTAHR